MYRLNDATLVLAALTPVPAAFTPVRVKTMLRPSAAVRVTPNVSSPVSTAATPVCPDIALMAVTVFLREREVSVDVEKEEV